MTLTPSSFRLDKKCGASGIAENKKCNKGAGSALQTGLKVAAVAGAITAGTVGAMKYRGMQRNALSNLGVAKTIRASGMGQGSVGRSAARTQARAQLASGAAPLSKVRARKAAKAGMATAKAGAARAQAAIAPKIAQARAAAGPTVGMVKARAASDLTKVKRAARRTQIGMIRKKRTMFGGQ